MKTFYIALGAALILVIGLRLHVPVKFLSLFAAGTALYLSYPLVLRRLKFDSGKYLIDHGGSTALKAPPTPNKVLIVSTALIILFFIAVKLHVKLKLLLLPLGAGIIYLFYPLLHGFFYNNGLPYDQDSNSLTLAHQSLAKHPMHWALGMVIAFILAFELHIKLLMYPLAAAIFYLYLPLLYCTGKKYDLQYSTEGEPANYFAYFWFGAWFGVCCFFSYMLAHLVTDILASFNLHIFRYLLIGVSFFTVGGCIYIWLLQKASRKIAVFEDIRTNYVKQGRLASFIVLFLLISYFLIKH